jgi:hypothetical protein
MLSASNSTEKRSNAETDWKYGAQNMGKRDYHYIGDVAFWADPFEMLAQTDGVRLL